MSSLLYYYSVMDRTMDSPAYRLTWFCFMFTSSCAPSWWLVLLFTVVLVVSLVCCLGHRL